MPVISLLTDFGLSDNYVGIMKGVICSICPAATIIDITHQIPPQDITAAAYALLSAYRFFPDHTIHLAVVDPGVGSGRRIVAVKMAGGIFIAPDNGLLGPILDTERIDEAVYVQNDRYFRHPVSRTFHGRDIFAPVAAHLALNGDMNRLGTRAVPENMIRLGIGPPEVGADGALTGAIIAVDRFGNLVTNIGWKDIAGIFGDPEIKRIVVEIKGERIDGISETYASAEPNAALALIGSGGMLEISVNLGNAGERFNAGPGDKVRVHRFS